MLNKKLTKTHLTQLFEKGETAEISGFKSPTKKTTFSAKVAWDLEKNRVTFVFPERPKAQASGIECPFCGGAVVESEFAFGCSNWKDKNCKFSVWKNKSKKLTIEQVSKMINESKTDVIDDMISKKGTKFKAYYELDKNGKKIEMKFAN
jgi:DNA topoisomerase-3